MQGVLACSSLKPDARSRGACAAADRAAHSDRTLTANEAEVGRVLQICNACRYCEGFCAVFPAMTRRLEFGKADIHFLANLCHNCGACLHACQYAPPHEFARQRAAGDGQGAAARPTPNTPGRRALGALYKRNGLTLSLALAAGARAVPDARRGDERLVVGRQWTAASTPSSRTT